jgi:hypothetical protein
MTPQQKGGEGYAQYLVQQNAMMTATSSSEHSKLDR